MDNKIRNAVKNFWDVRSGGQGVLGGKTLDGFIEVIREVITNSGIDGIEIHTGKNTSQLPGYFRPHKSWDVCSGQLQPDTFLKEISKSIGD